MVVTSDVSTSAGLDRFRKLYSQNYIDVGIAEQNLIGVSAGLAMKDLMFCALHLHISNLKML